MQAAAAIHIATIPAQVSIDPGTCSCSQSLTFLKAANHQIGGHVIHGDQDDEESQI